MKKILTFSAAIIFCFAAFAQKNAKVINGSIESRLLGTDRAYTVILPPGYEENQDKSYPILYLLHGMYGYNTEWAEKGKAGIEMARMIKEYTCYPMIIVSPFAGGEDAVNQQNGYFDMQDWPYERFFFEEFLPFIEKGYRVIGDKEHRAIAGLSMGGGGATAYAQKHPDMFCAVYAMSAWLCLTERHTGGDRSKLGKIVHLHKAVDENNCVEFVKNADASTVEALKTINWFVDCGDDDFLLEPNLDFYVAMRSKGIPCELRVRDGVHRWEYWYSALGICLPFVSMNFGK